MKRFASFTTVVVTFLLAIFSPFSTAAGLAAPDRAKLHRTMKAGNFKDAFTGFKQLCFDSETDPRQVPRRSECSGPLSEPTESDQRG